MAKTRPRKRWCQVSLPHVTLTDNYRPHSNPVSRGKDRLGMKSWSAQLPTRPIPIFLQRKTRHSRLWLIQPRKLLSFLHSLCVLANTTLGSRWQVCATILSWKKYLKTWIRVPFKYLFWVVAFQIKRLVRLVKLRTGAPGSAFMFPVRDTSVGI